MTSRGLIKWQPFNSLITANQVLTEINNTKQIAKPMFFPEKIQELNEKIMEAYYAQNIITLIIYQNNKLYKIKTKIKEIAPSFNTLKLNNNRTISFNQIIDIN